MSNSGWRRSTTVIHRMLRRSAECLEDCSSSLRIPIEKVAAIYATAIRSGGRLWFAGNGGSAAQAMHTAAEYSVRFTKGPDRPAFPAFALVGDPVALTAAGNDYGMAGFIARGVEAHCRPGDVLVLYSTSGESLNLLEAAGVARRSCVLVVAWVGSLPCHLAELADYVVRAPSELAWDIQLAHLACEHAVTAMVLDLLAQPVAPALDLSSFIHTQAEAQR